MRQGMARLALVAILLKDVTSHAVLFLFLVGDDLLLSGGIGLSASVGVLRNSGAFQSSTDHIVDDLLLLIGHLIVDVLQIRLVVFGLSDRHRGLGVCFCICVIQL